MNAICVCKSHHPVDVVVGVNVVLWLVQRWMWSCDCCCGMVVALVVAVVAVPDLQQSLQSLCGHCSSHCGHCNAVAVIVAVIGSGCGSDSHCDHCCGSRLGHCAAIAAAIVVATSSSLQCYSFGHLNKAIVKSCPCVCAFDYFIFVQLCLCLCRLVAVE